MLFASECPNCSTPLPKTPANSEVVVCPRCRQPISAQREATIDAASSRVGTKREGFNYIIPLGYAAFVGLPLVLVAFIYYWVNRPDKPHAPVHAPAEVAAASPEQPASNSKSHSGFEGRKKPAVPAHESEANPQTGSGDSPSSKLEPSTPADPNAIAPPPRLIEVKEFGTLRLTTLAPVRPDVQAWVEIDGIRAATFKANTKLIEVQVPEGPHAIKVVSIYQSVRRTVFENSVEIAANRVKEVSVESGK